MPRFGMSGHPFNAVLGLAVLWMLVAIPVAAFTGDGIALRIVTAVLLGPFMAFGVALVLAFALGLILYGDDHLVDKLIGGDGDEDPIVSSEREHGILWHIHHGDKDPRDRERELEQLLARTESDLQEAELAVEGSRGRSMEIDAAFADRIAALEVREVALVEALERIAAEWRPNSSESPDDWVAWAQSTAISALADEREESE